MGLREQIVAIGSEKVHPEFAKRVNWWALVKELAIRAFQEQWPEDSNTRAIRQALILMESKGFINDDEPEVS